MSQKKKLTTNAGVPVVDNQNTMTAGPCGPDYSLFYESHNERSKYHE
jgi:catalase